MEQRRAFKNKMRRQRDYKGVKCPTCGVEVTFRSKSGFCKIHVPYPKWPEERKKRLSVSVSGAKNHRFGTKLTVEARMKLSEANRGKNAWNWKGGITPVWRQLRRGIDYTLWRTAVFERDNYTCQICGIRGGTLNADHIKPFAYFPADRLSLENGRTLCVECHRKTPTYGFKARYYADVS